MAAKIKLKEAPEARVYFAEWRKTKFATQQDLADAMDTTAATVSRIETGEREWYKGYVEALAYLVGCQVADLFQSPGKGRNNASLDKLMRLAGSLSENQIAGLIALFDSSSASEPRESPAAEGLPTRKAKAKPA